MWCECADSVFALQIWVGFGFLVGVVGVMWVWYSWGGVYFCGLLVSSTFGFGLLATGCDWFGRYGFCVRLSGAGLGFWVSGC